MPLNNVQVKSAKGREKPYRLADGKGMYLEVRPTGQRYFRYRYRIDGKENTFTIGQYPEKSLAQAREDLTEARSLVSKGLHPTQIKNAVRLQQAADRRNTFMLVAEDWIESKTNNWTARYRKQVEDCLSADVYPVIGELPMRDITASQILHIIRKAEKRGAATVALLERQWCSAIFRFGVATLRADFDPASALRGAITRPPVEHRKPLSRSDIPEFLKAHQKHGGSLATRIAMKLVMLTFVRPGEVRGAMWSEFNLDAAEWHIPAERMKMRRKHIVPLSKQALELLYDLHDLTGSQKWLFPNARRPKEFMDINTLNRVIERMGYAGRFSSHGFRATASTILNESGFRGDIIERQLAHQERNAVRASYNQAEYLDERREMMQAWADMIDGLVAGDNVVPLKSKKQSVR